jgi:Zn-dependent protease with chaperone function
MFGNFIYFIVALLIYATYQPTGETNFSPGEALLLLCGSITAFTLFTRYSFLRLIKGFDQGHFTTIDHKLSTLCTKLSILSIALFAVDIYGLNLSAFLVDIPLFKALPTLEALVFLALFILHLIIVWSHAYFPNKRFLHMNISRWDYIGSNLSFSLPVLLPWLLLSGLADIIMALPFDWPKELLNTTEGNVISFLVLLIVVAIFGPALIQRFWRCKPLEAGFDRQRIEALCSRAGLKYANILYWPIFGGRMITAGVMGLVNRFRYILVTNALLRLLAPEEIDAVIAHEIGHVKRRHLVFYLFFFVGFMTSSFALFDHFAVFLFLTEPVKKLVLLSGLSYSELITTLNYSNSIAFIAVFILYFRYIFGYFMRNFERQADIYSFTLFKTTKPLISTFYKIAASSGQAIDKPNWHHYSIRERITYLQRCESDPIWISRHERKVRRSIITYLIATLLIGIIGYQIHQAETLSSMVDRNTPFFDRLLINQINELGEQPERYYLLGDLHFERKQYADAIAAYEQSLELDPHQAVVLNNLAWLLVTCEEPMLRDPKRALDLALQAVAKESPRPSPQILDTLAESYYANGSYAKALDMGIRALALAKRDRKYFRSQIEKFRSTLESIK